MERKNTDQNISPISVRICLNGYRLSFIRDSRHVNAYRYQKSHIRPSVVHFSSTLSLSPFLIYLSSFLHFFPRTIQDSWKAIERFLSKWSGLRRKIYPIPGYRRTFVQQSTFQGSASMEKQTLGMRGKSEDRYVKSMRRARVGLFAREKTRI